MLLSECPEGLPFEVSFRGQLLKRYRRGGFVYHVGHSPNGAVALRTTRTEHPPQAYTVIKRLFREDGDD